MLVVQSGQLILSSKEDAQTRLNEIQSLFEKQVEKITSLQAQIMAAEKVVFSCLSEQRQLQEWLNR